MDLTIDLLLTNTSGNELGGLGAKIKDQDLLVMYIHSAVVSLCGSVVRSFFCNNDIVDMGFTQTGSGNFNKLCFFP